MHHKNALFWGGPLKGNPGIDSCFHPQVDMQLKFILGLSNLGTLFCGIDWFMTVQSLFITRWCAPLRELHVVLWLLLLLLLRKRPLSEVISKTNEDKTDEVNPEFTSVTKSWTSFPPRRLIPGSRFIFGIKGGFCSCSLFWSQSELRTVAHKREYGTIALFRCIQCYKDDIWFTEDQLQNASQQ